MIASVRSNTTPFVQIEDNQAEALLIAKLSERLFTIAGLDNRIGVGGKSRAHDAADLRFVIAHEYRCGIHCESPREAAIGKVKEKTEPCPNWVVTLIVPPCASTMALAIGNPIPVP